MSVPAAACDLFIDVVPEKVEDYFADDSLHARRMPEAFIAPDERIVIVRDGCAAVAARSVEAAPHPMETMGERGVASLPHLGEYFVCRAAKREKDGPGLKFAWNYGPERVECLAQIAYLYLSL